MKMHDQLMITGLTTVLRQSVYLTGSRAFGTENSHSDFDVYTETNEGVVIILKSLGFTPLAPKAALQYSDSNTASVWRKDYIDVQLVHNVVLKTQVQDFLLKYNGGFLLNHIPKTNRKLIWNMIKDLMVSSILLPPDGFNPEEWIKYYFGF